jgi:hypothetical protein
MTKHILPALSAVGGSPNIQFIKTVLATGEMEEVRHLLAAANIEVTKRMSEGELEAKLAANLDLTATGKHKITVGLKRAGLIY